MKYFDSLIPGEASQPLDYLSFSHSLKLSLPTRGETEIAGLGVRNGLLNPSLAKTFMSILP
jgi:hypothetical protein